MLFIDPKMAEKSSDVIIISDSESDSEQQSIKKEPPNDTYSLFQEFFSCCHEMLSAIRGESQVKKVENHLMKVHKAARKDFVKSEEFANTLTQHISELKAQDVVTKSVFTHIHDVVVLLRSATPGPKSTREKNAALVKSRPKDEAEDKKLSTGELEKIKTNSDGASENVGKPSCSENVDSLSSSKDEDSPSCSRDVDSPSSSKDAVNSDDKSSVSDAKAQKVRRLEKLMGRLDKAICKYSEKEMSLNDLGREDSAHMIEHKLRKRFVEAWQKWCKLKGYEAKTGRATEKKLKFEGTRYQEINRKIQKLMNKGKFPDFHDVFRIIQRINSSCDLGIHKFDLHQMSKEVFEDIGEKIRMQRAQDHICNFGYVVLAEVPEDPALESEDLKSRLEENANIGKQMMDSVFEKYTRKQNECMSKGVLLEADNTSEPEAIPDSEAEGEWEEYDEDESREEETETVDESQEEELKSVDESQDDEVQIVSVEGATSNKTEVSVKEETEVKDQQPVTEVNKTESKPCTNVSELDSQSCPTESKAMCQSTTHVKQGTGQFSRKVDEIKSTPSQSEDKITSPSSSSVSGSKTSQTSFKRSVEELPVSDVDKPAKVFKAENGSHVGLFNGATCSHVKSRTTCPTEESRAVQQVSSAEASAHQVKTEQKHNAMKCIAPQSISSNTVEKKEDGTKMSITTTAVGQKQFATKHTAPQRVTAKSVGQRQVATKHTGPRRITTNIAQVPSNAATQQPQSNVLKVTAPSHNVARKHTAPTISGVGRAPGVINLNLNSNGPTALRTQSPGVNCNRLTPLSLRKNGPTPGNPLNGGAEKRTNEDEDVVIILD